MRRWMIYALMGLLLLVIVLDYQTTSDNPRRIPPATAPTAAGISATPTPAIIAELPTIAASATATSLPTFTYTPAPTENPTRAAVIMTLTQMHFDATSSAFRASSIAHTLQAGDTPIRLADLYDVPLEAILRANGIVDPTRLRVGEVLIIPVGVPLESIAALPTPVPQFVAAARIPVPTATRILFELGNITPVFSPPPQLINGVPFEMVIVLPDNVREHVRTVYAQGQAMGNNPRAFSKLGDSTIEHPFFLGRFDDGPYNLGEYAFLKPVIDYFSGSFRRESVAVRRGLHTWSVLDPMWSPKPACQPGEHMLACEFRLNRPSVLFIRLGSNDAGIPDSTDENLRDIVTYALDNGVIPILSTKADRHEGPSGINNTIIRQIAADYAIPLWDFDVMAQTLPGRGLEADGVHLTTFFAHDYTQPQAMQRGHGVHNLTALLMLDMLWREMYAAG